jgi:cyanate lyase
MLDWPDATDRLRAAKEASGLTFAALAGAVDRDEVWTASLLLGAGNDSEVEARAPCAALDVTEDEVVAAVQRPPIKGQSDPSIPSDHMLYRLYEILQVYGDAIKACVHEEFGDGIMSATDVECHVAFPTRTATGSGSPTKGSISRTESDSRGLSRPAVARVPRVTTRDGPVRGGRSGSGVRRQAIPNCFITLVTSPRVTRPTPASTSATPAATISDSVATSPMPATTRTTPATPTAPSGSNTANGRRERSKSLPFGRTTRIVCGTSLATGTRHEGPVVVEPRV